METFETYLLSRYPKNTTGTYLYTISKFKSENPEADDFTYQDVMDYLLQLQQNNLSCAYRVKILSALKKYYDFLKSTSYRDDHPCSRIKINDDTKKGVIFDDLFTPDELHILMERTERYPILEMKNKVIISLLIYQGLTSEEVTRISVNDVNLDTGTVHIKSAKKTKSRNLDLHRTQIMIFSKYIHEVRPQLIRTNSDVLIITKIGTAISVDDVHSILQPMKLLFPNKTLHPRQVRLSVIANWLNVQKIPLSDVQLLAGHRWPSTTEKYFRTDLVEKHKLINKYHPLERMELISN